MPSLAHPAVPATPADPVSTAQYLRGMERLVRAVQELSLARNLPAIQVIVRRAARELTGADGATFVLRDSGQCHYADEDAIAPLWKGKRFPLETCISGWAMLNRLPAVIPDIYKDPRIPHEAYRPTFVKSLAMVPIRTMDPIGAIGNYWANRHLPSEREVALLQALADTTAVAMENVKVYGELEQRVDDRTRELQQANIAIERLSLSDELTGVHNRRGFYLLAEQAIRVSLRQARAAYIVFIDVDGLKAVNDQLGHEAGDGVIADVARAIKATFRDSDVIGRIGGDEFAVLTLDWRGDQQTMRARLTENLAATGAGKPYPLSASVGIAEIGDGSEGLDALLTRADQSMYMEKRAKRAGRQ